MFSIDPLDPPETVEHAGGTAVLTHKATLLRVDPRSEGDALVVREMKGYLVDGQFQDWGDHTLHVMDRQGLQDMLADTTGGKPAGAFRTTDVLPAIERRRAAREAPGRG